MFSRERDAVSKEAGVKNPSRTFPFSICVMAASACAAVLMPIPILCGAEAPPACHHSCAEQREVGVVFVLVLVVAVVVVVVVVVVVAAAVRFC